MTRWTDTAPACTGEDMTPIGHTAGQIADDAQALIESCCNICPPAEKTRCHQMRRDSTTGALASGIWGGRYYPPKKGQIT